MTPSGAAVGQRVYLSGILGLPAGYYTLLPAQYATLPGAYRVVQQPGTTNFLPGQNTIQPDGSVLVSGNLVGQTQTMTLLVEEKYQNFEQASAYAISALLAFAAIVCLVVVSVLRPKEDEA